MVIVTSVVTLNVIMLSVVAPEEVLASIKLASLSLQNVNHDLKSFINWNNEEYFQLQLKKDREARKWHFLLKKRFTTKNGKVHSPNLSFCLWECFERVCQHLIFEMKQQWRMFTTTTKERWRSQEITIFSFFSTSKYGKAPGFNLSVCLWEHFEWVCQHLIFEMKQQRIFMGTNKDRQRSKKMNFFQPLKMEKPPVLICLWECFEWVPLPDFLNETAMNNIYDYK